MRLEALKKYRKSHWPPGTWTMPVQRNGAVWACFLAMPGGLYQTDNRYDDETDWLHYEEPQPKKEMLMAPAVVAIGRNQRFLNGLFQSEEEARADCDAASFRFISWPAIPNKDGFYEVQE